jgi:NitT/TauT family transport system substrate-binding protein
MSVSLPAWGGCAALAALVAFAGGALPAASAPAPTVIRIKLSVDEDPIVPRLAQSLGYFKDEGVEIVPVKVEDFSGDDFRLQTPLDKGQIDAVYHWFHHTVFGARHNIPVTAVMLMNDAPGMTVMVANRVKDQIKGPADFRGRRIAQGAGYGTKSMLTDFLAKKAGLPPGSYTPVMSETQGRQAAILKGLADGTVDVMTAEDPIASALIASGKVSTLLDLTNAPSTRQALGGAWPAQSLLVSPKYIAAHPEAVQHLVNALVRSMRFVNSHTLDQIVAQLPPDYFAGKDRKAEIELIAKSLPSFTKGNYAFNAHDVSLELGVLQGFGYDKSDEGQWRATAESTKITPAQLYTNRFVDAAMKHYPK